MVITPQHTSPCYIGSLNRNEDTSMRVERMLILLEMELLVISLLLILVILIRSHKD